MINKEILQDNLKKIFGFNSFRGQQENIILNLLEGNDSMVIMPTGGGKSMCYQLPAILSKGVAIIISPLIALMKNLIQIFIKLCWKSKIPIKKLALLCRKYKKDT